MQPCLEHHQARAEADRCLLCHDAPCSKACPAGTDPGLFIRKFRLKNLTGAYRTIKSNNILGGACGILCPSERLCEKECSASGIDAPVRIGELQRYIVEQGWRMEMSVLSRSSEGTGQVAIIGSGPAGLACAAEVARAGHRVTLFEAREKIGGVLRYGVPEHRFSQDFLDRELADLKGLGIEFRTSTPVASCEEAQTLLEHGYDAVFMAPGLGQATSLLDPAVEAVHPWTTFLSTMKTDEAAYAKRVAGKPVAVIGGGSVAMDCVESLLKAGAQDVYLVYRRSYNQMPAEEDEKLAALRGGAHFLMLNQPTGVTVDGDRQTALQLVRTRLGDPDGTGRRRPEPIEGSEWSLPVELIVEAIGAQPEQTFRESFPHTMVDDRGYLIASPEQMATPVQGLYAGGDMVRGASLIVHAIGDGKTAGAAIVEQLSRKGA